MNNLFTYKDDKGDIEFFCDVNEVRSASRGYIPYLGGASASGVVVHFRDGSEQWLTEVEAQDFLDELHEAVRRAE